LETYFLSDSQIQHWLDQLIEKIIAVSQSEEQNQTEYSLEFEKGRQLVEEITGLLTNISSMPPSSVFDPIIHLIEQRLQCQKIVDLTNFNKVMEAMVSEGIALVSGESDIESRAIPALATANQNSTQFTPTLVNANITGNNTIANTLQQSSLQFNEKTIQVNSFPVIKNEERVKILTEQFKTSETELQQNSQKELSFSKKRRINNSSLIPTEATRLALVLKQIFPNSQARWNFSLGEYYFLVQVEDILIYLETDDEGQNIEKEMKKQGWNILVCKTEDLAFPRRFERAISRILKNSKHFNN
jgi:hypothetical protein